jgi:hypothetical protein
MPVPKSIAPRKQWMQSIMEDNGAGLRIELFALLPTIPTAAGTVEIPLIVPEDGYLHSVEVSFNEALVANDTNYVMFNMVNYGQDGLGTVAMLVATGENTTRVLAPGAPLNAKARRSLALAFPVQLLKARAGDRIGFRVVGNGTLANTLTGGAVLARFVP